MWITDNRTRTYIGTLLGAIGAIGAIGWIGCSESAPTSAPAASTVKTDVDPGGIEPSPAAASDKTGDEARAIGFNIQRVHYYLDWHWGSSEKTKDGWKVITPSGSQVFVKKGYLTTHGVALVPCKTPPAPASGSQGLLDIPNWLFKNVIGPAMAYAGHGQQLDPSTLQPSIVENLFQPMLIDAGRVSFPAAVYCQVHYLVARAAESATGLPADGIMLGSSLHLEGEYRMSSTRVATPFRIHTTIANGGLRPISLPEASLDPALTLRVTVTRDLSQLFDDVDFTEKKETMVARQVLKNLVNHLSTETVWSSEP